MYYLFSLAVCIRQGYAGIQTIQPEVNRLSMAFYRLSIHWLS